MLVVEPAVLVLDDGVMGCQPLQLSVAFALYAGTLLHAKCK